MKMQWEELHQWGQWLEPQAHLKRVVANRVMEGFVVAMLNIRKDFIPCAWMFGVVHSQNMHNHFVDHLYFSITQNMFEEDLSSGLGW
jgi:hypothetical protein